MKAITIRVDDYTFDRLNILAKENKLSLNKIITQIINETLERPTEMLNCLENFDSKLDNIIKEVEIISKRQISHIKVSKQHFVNHGYLSNADIKEDKCLKELLDKDNSFND